MRPIASLAAVVLSLPASAATVYVSDLDLSVAKQGWGTTRKDLSITEKPLTIAGKVYARGVGSHAAGVLYIRLNGGATRFRAEVGCDDAALPNRGSIVFRVYADGRQLWKSRVMRTGEPALPVDLDVRGARTLVLVSDGAGDGVSYDHADWADARLETGGVAPGTMAVPAEKRVILTPKPSPRPRINSAPVFGVRPGRPVLYTIAATGQRPMTFGATGLPKGVTLDAASGVISGKVAKPGTYRIRLAAANSLGKATKELRLVVGDQLALTPPMGWNSWYCYLTSVTQRLMESAADAMVASGMKDHGYVYVNIDDGWMTSPDSEDPQNAGPELGPTGAIRPNAKFPDMKGLADYIHARGLKAGLYTSPGPRTCAGFAGSYRHEAQDARQFADWGYDFLKYDWCTYKGDTGRLTDLQKPYALMYGHLKALNRDLVYNLCQYGMGEVWKWGAKVGGNCWRTTGDLGATNDLWESMSSIGFGQWDKVAWNVPGHYNDPDYILIGDIWWQGAIRPTPLTPNEQYTYMSLWSLLACPLIFSGDMRKLNDFTLNVLCNDEVIAVNQDPLCRSARRVSKDDLVEVWSKDLEDGSRAVGLFNRHEVPVRVTAKWSDLGISGPRYVRDLWRQKTLGRYEGSFSANVPRHGVFLVRLFPTRKR